MKTTNIIITLLIVAIGLLLADLLTGIWYWNKLNLNFSPSNYNDIVTPIFSVIATIIYAWALFNTIKQNKIILSQNIKPYYEKEVENLKSKAEGIIIDGTLLSPTEPPKITALNFIKIINDTIITLSQNQEFLEDYKKYEQNDTLTKEYFEKRNYYGKLLFLAEFTMEINSISFFYRDIKLLIEEINQSKLIPEEKELFKKRIKRTLLNEYMAFIDFLDKHPLIVPPIPILYDLQKKNIEFKLLSQTNFRKHFDWFKNELKD